MINSRQVKRSLIIACVVGTVLTATNQYEAIFGAQIFNYLKASITYIIPFCVSLTVSLMERKQIMVDVPTTPTIEPESLKDVQNVITSIETLSARIHTTASDVNAATKVRLSFAQEAGEISSEVK
jgi:hypothetical protein